MSTNFYLQSTDGNGEHIGKRSGGWTFMFCGQNHKDLQGWRRRLDAMGARESIQDEYGETYTATQFWAEVEATKIWRSAKVDAQAYPDGTGRKWEEAGYSFNNYEFC